VPGLPLPLKVQTITEKRATFACVPNLKRPPTRTALPGLWLAGDYVAGDYPATLEGRGDEAALRRREKLRG
jgi:thioredoxin reductase